MSYVGTYSTVKCSKTFKMGKDTLSKYLKSGQAYKGQIYSRTKLHNNNFNASLSSLKT
jgi:hypothetical protein